MIVLNIQSIRKILQLKPSTTLKVSRSAIFVLVGLMSLQVVAGGLLWYADKVKAANYDINITGQGSNFIAYTGTPRFTGVAPAGAELDVYIDSELAGTTQALQISGGPGAWSFVPQQELTPGQHNLEVRAKGSQKYAYYAPANNSDSGDDDAYIRAIDLESGALTGNIRVGLANIIGKPIVAATKNRVYVLSTSKVPQWPAVDLEPTTNITVINASTGDVVKTITREYRAAGVSLSLDEGRLVVYGGKILSTESSQSEVDVDVVDTSTDSIISSTSFGSPTPTIEGVGTTITADGSRIVLVNQSYTVENYYYGSVLYNIDLANMDIQAVQLGVTDTYWAYNGTLSPDSTKAYMKLGGQHQGESAAVMQVNLITGATSPAIGLTAESLYSTALSPGGDSMWALTNGSGPTADETGRLQKINLNTNQVVGEIGLGDFTDLNNYDSEIGLNSLGTTGYVLTPAGLLKLDLGALQVMSTDNSVRYVSTYGNKKLTIDRSTGLGYVSFEGALYYIDFETGAIADTGMNIAEYGVFQLVNGGAYAYYDPGNNATEYGLYRYDSGTNTVQSIGNSEELDDLSGYQPASISLGTTSTYSANASQNLDFTVRTVKITSPTPAQSFGSSSYNVVGVTSANTEVQVYANDALKATVTSDSQGDWQASVAGLSPGQIIFRAKVRSISQGIDIWGDIGFFPAMQGLETGNSYHYDPVDNTTELYNESLFGSYWPLLYYPDRDYALVIDPIVYGGPIDPYAPMQVKKYNVVTRQVEATGTIGTSWYTSLMFFGTAHFSADGTKLYVIDYNGDSFLVIDTATLETTSILNPSDFSAIGGKDGWIFAIGATFQTPDKTTIYITDWENNRLIPFNTLTDTLGQPIDLSVEEPQQFQYPLLGKIVTQDGTKAYLPGYGGIRVVDVASGLAVDLIETGGNGGSWYSTQLFENPARQEIYSLNYNEGSDERTLTTISTITNEVVHTALVSIVDNGSALNLLYSQMAMSQDASTLILVDTENSNILRRYDVASRTFLAPVELSAPPLTGIRRVEGTDNFVFAVPGSAGNFYSGGVLFNYNLTTNGLSEVNNVWLGAVGDGTSNLFGAFSSLSIARSLSSLAYNEATVTALFQVPESPPPPPPVSCTVTNSCPPPPPPVSCTATNTCPKPPTCADTNSCSTTSVTPPTSSVTPKIVSTQFPTPTATPSTSRLGWLDRTALAVARFVPQQAAIGFPFLLFALLLLFALSLHYQANNEIRKNDINEKFLEKRKAIRAQQDNFIALASHYLNTPITIIQGGVELEGAKRRKR